MTWTTAAPTQPGWYWFRNEENEVSMCFVYLADNGVLYADCTEQEELLAVTSMVGEWAGPLEPPA